MLTEKTTQRSIMSGLETFRDSPTWRKKMRDFLLLECSPAKLQPAPLSRAPALDVVLDFPALIKAKKGLTKKKHIEENKTGIITNINSEEEEDMEQLNETARNHLADDSFEAFERMCEKTGSDPDSTLFQYLHSDDKCPAMSLVNEGVSHSDKSSDMQMDAMHRMFKELNDQEELERESPLKGIECTQLEDIEAPSRFWDDSTANSNDSVFQPTAKTSPVKMVGLLRPSTILETNEGDLTEVSSYNSSFKTAAKMNESFESGSSCYETAGDSSRASSSKEATSLDVDDLFYAAIAKAKPHGMSKGEQEELLNDLHETLMNDLVDNTHNQTVLSDLAENTIIELSSSSDEEVDYTADIKEENISMCKDLNEENKENKSMHFNDTIEEMEYMMQKGLDIMAAKAAPSPATTVKPLLNQSLLKQKTFVVTPEKQPCTPLQQGSNNKQPKKSGNSRYDLTMNLPKTKFLKHLTAIPMRLNAKTPKDQFSHIASPIRAYTQKSGTAPLMSTFRPTQNIPDELCKLSERELEQESRLRNLGRTNSANTVNCNSLNINLEGIIPTGPLLPKKAYESSELKQVVDERTPIQMPNVQQIQKYLNSAVEPAVLRHDGKMKIPGQAVSHIPRRPNKSLADLSLVSGDISMYTIKDAQKFN